jgi:hypothetical protein
MPAPRIGLYMVAHLNQGVRVMTTTTDTDSPAEDRLQGAEAIARYLGLGKRELHHRIYAGDLPVGRERGRLVASKRRLREYWRQLTSGEPAVGDAPGPARQAAVARGHRARRAAAAT